MKTRRRFNALDFLVLFLILATLLTLVMRGELARRLGLEDVGTDTAYTLFVSAVERDEAALFVAGQTIIDPATGDVLGTIRSAAKENSVVYTVSDRGVVQAAYDRTHFDITLVIDGKAKSTDRGLLLNGVLFATPGDVLEIYLSDTRVNATVLPNKTDL